MEDDGNLSTQFVPYFSRRIGLVDGRSVPIDEGAKLVGHAGRFSIGALDVQTGGSPVAPATNLGVARAAYNVTHDLRIGTLLTRGDPTGLTDNSFAGVDSVWHTSRFRGDKNLTLSGWLGHSDGVPARGNHDGYGFAIQYPNDLWSARLRVNVFGDGFDPALGYLPRPGTRQYMLFGGYQPRPHGGAFGWVRQFHLASEYIQVEDLHGHVQSSVFMAVPLRFTTNAGYFFSTLFSSEYEALGAPFKVSRNVAIPVGRYRFNQLNIGGHTPQSWPWTISVNATMGDFYTGTTRQGSAELDWTGADGRLQLGLKNENDFVYLPQGDFTVRLTQLNGAWSFTPDLSLSAFAQYDNISRKSGITARLQWIVQPGRELFLVFNHGIEPQLADLNHAPPAGNVLTAKLRWDFRR